MQESAGGRDAVRMFKEVATFGLKPRPRLGATLVHVEDRIFLVGGLDSSSYPLEELWECNLLTRVWTRSRMHGEVPEELADHSAVLHPKQGGTMLLYNAAWSNDVFTCKLESGSFSKLAVDTSNKDTDWPRPGLEGLAVAVDKDQGRLYTVGGRNLYGNRCMDVHQLELDPGLEQPRWTALHRTSGQPGEPKGRSGHKIAIRDGTLFVLGGDDDDDEVCGLKELPSFSLKEKKWYISTTTVAREKEEEEEEEEETEKYFPVARSHHSVVQIKDAVWVLGGVGREWRMLDDVWILNLDTLVWSKCPAKLPQALCSTATTVSDDGKVVMFGGKDKYGEVNNKVYEARLQVPELKTLAWEAMCHHNGPGMASYTDQKLEEVLGPLVGGDKAKERIKTLRSIVSDPVDELEQAESEESSDEDH